VDMRGRWHGNKHVAEFAKNTKSVQHSATSPIRPCSAF
jgi:hypothetical protein